MFEQKRIVSVRCLLQIVVHNNVHAREIRLISFNPHATIRRSGNHNGTMTMGVDIKKKYEILQV